MLSPTEVKQCPLPGCDSTGNTKNLYAFHRSISRCPLIRIKIEGLRGILTIKEVEQILAGRRELPDLNNKPEPTTDDGLQLLEDLKLFTRSNSKKKSANSGGKQQSAGVRKNGENRLPKMGESAKQTAAAVSSNGDNEQGAATPRDMILIGPRKDVKQSLNKGNKKSLKVIRVNNENALNANGSNGKKRKLEEIEETTFNGGQKRKPNSIANGKPDIVVTAAEPLEPSLTFSRLNCDLDSLDLSKERTRHLQYTYKQAVQKVKTLQDTEFALTRRLSAAQKGIEELRPKKAQLASALQKAMQDFIRLCKEIAPLNTEPLSTDCSDADAINTYLGRIALVSEQRDSSVEAESLFNLIRDQLKDFWQEMQMNPQHSQNQKSSQSPPARKSLKASRPKSTFSSHTQ